MYYSIFKINFFGSLQIKNYLFLTYSPALHVSRLHRACRSATLSYFSIHVSDLLQHPLPVDPSPRTFPVDVISCNAISCDIISCDAISRDIISCDAISFPQTSPCPALPSPNALSLPADFPHLGASELESVLYTYIF